MGASPREAISTRGERSECLGAGEGAAPPLRGELKGPRMCTADKPYLIPFRDPPSLGQDKVRSQDGERGQSWEGHGQGWVDGWMEREEGLRDGVKNGAG